MVGGGSLYSYFMGSADVACDDGSSMLLSGVLYVLKLGINLLSGRKLYEDGFKDEFDAGHYTSSSEIVIKGLSRRQ